MLAARDGERIFPLGRIGPVMENLDLIAGGISFTPQRSKAMLDLFLQRHSHCGSDCGCHEVVGIGESATLNPSRNSIIDPTMDPLFQKFAARVLAGEANAKDLMRVTITSFLDAYNFDIRQLMKCCTHHVLPSGHVVPFCAYNTLYRPGHLKLPPITK